MTQFRGYWTTRLNQRRSAAPSLGLVWAIKAEAVEGISDILTVDDKAL